jgi:uncharacterized protein YndB with AHSA1/START domain
MKTMGSSGTATVTLRGDTEILIEREFDAPPNLVYEACTTPDLIRRWWAGKRGTVTEVEVDLREGGDWRQVMEATGGFEVAFHGTYRELVPNERIVTTEVFEGMPDAYAVNTITFEPLDGDRTKLTVLVEHQEKAHRDAHIDSGMEGGMQEAYDLLEQVAIELERRPA